MQYKKLSLLFYFLINSQFIFSQLRIHDAQFNSPVDFPIYLSGNFGEIRSTHFHSGIDIKTQGVIGKNIYAVEDGYISRIRVSANSYGKTIYISHPNGYTTVYGHLNNFNNKIEQLVKNIQYQNREFVVNHFPKANEFPVKKGQIIGLSGNTGNSAGPHLHFEVRFTNGQIPVNPLLFNFKIDDTISPSLYSLSVYPLGANSTINDQESPIKYDLVSNGGMHYIADTGKIYLSGKIGFGIEMNDFLNNSRNRCGIYNLSFFVNDEVIYKYTIDKFSFGESGYVKSHIDYAEKNKSKKTIQKIYLDPNNKLSIYNSVKNNGIYVFEKDTSYSIKLIAEDVHGNQSELSFIVFGQEPQLPTPVIAVSNGDVFMNWNTENIYENEEIKLVIPKQSLYDTLYFKYSKTEATDSFFSSIHHIHNMYTPIHKNYDISIKVLNLPEELKAKAFIAKLEDDNTVSSIGGEIVNDFIVSKTNSFGNYAVMIDTISPVIKNASNKTNLINGKIEFLISDSLSGIKSYNGYIDNSWALFEYDLKNDLLFYTMDEEKIERNKEHELELFVVDNNENISTYHTTFYW